MDAPARGPAWLAPAPGPRSQPVGADPAADSPPGLRPAEPSRCRAGHAGRARTVAPRPGPLQSSVGRALRHPRGRPGGGGLGTDAWRRPLMAAARFEAKILDRAACEHAVREGRFPRPLVFTNGVFDILHRGHVTYLDQAARLGASLIVGVNTDASVRRLGKG